MRAEQYIKDHGLEKARGVVSGASELWFAYDAHDQVYIRCGDIQDGYSIADYEDCFLLDELKRLVESVDRVNKRGGYLATKELLNFSNVHQEAFGKDAVSDETINSLKAEIKDYESIYGEGNDL